MIKMLKRYNAWKNSWSDPESITLDSYVSFNIHPEDALITYGVLFQEFIQIDECVFLKKHFDEANYKSWQDKLDNNAQIEKVINHIHLYDVFANCQDNVEDDIFEALAEKVGYFWRLRLSNEFPDKNFIVEVSNTDQNYGPEVVFYQK